MITIFGIHRILTNIGYGIDIFPIKGGDMKLITDEKCSELIEIINNKVDDFKKTDCNAYCNPIDTFVSHLGNILFNSLDFNKNPLGSDSQVFYSNLIGEIVQEVKKQIYLCLIKEKVEEMANNLDSKIKDNFDNWFLTQMEWKRNMNFLLSYPEQRLEEYILERKSKECK